MYAIRSYYVIHHLTIPEGLTVQQIFERIYNEPLLEGDITIPVKEGWLLPETYAFSLGDDRNKLVERMQRSMIDFIDSEWDNRASNLPFKTKEDAINLAAIVEKETSLTIERPRVAGVYINRLRKRMRLQADPTVIYVVITSYSIHYTKLYDTHRSITSICPCSEKYPRSWKLREI